MNPINEKDNKYFQYNVTVAFYHAEVKKNPQGITKTKPFRNSYNWEGECFPSEKKRLDKIEKNNLTIALNVLLVKKEKIYPAYVSKHNSNREKQFILLMIPNGEGWHYLAVKKLSALLTGITFKHHRDFHCLNCIHSFPR